MLNTYAENIRFERMRFLPNKTQAYRLRPLGQFSLSLYFFYFFLFFFISTSFTFSSYPFLLFLHQIQSSLFFFFFYNHIIHFSSCFFICNIFTPSLHLISLRSRSSILFFFFFSIFFLPILHLTS